MLQKGWPHDPAKNRLKWPHEPANRQYRLSLEDKDDRPRRGTLACELNRSNTTASVYRGSGGGSRASSASAPVEAAPSRT